MVFLCSDMCLFIHSSVEGHLSCLHLVAIDMLLRTTDTHTFSMNTCFQFLGGTHLGIDSLGHVIIL